MKLTIQMPSSTSLMPMRCPESTLEPRRSTRGQAWTPHAPSDLNANAVAQVQQSVRRRLLRVFARIRAEHHYKMRIFQAGMNKRISPVLALAFLLVIAPDASAEFTQSSGRQWQMLEFDFVSQQSYDAPMSVQLSALFSGPDGLNLEVPGFWDGGDTWKIRFTPTMPGEWRYVTTASDRSNAGLHEQHGVISVSAPAAGGLLTRHGGFLKVSESRRYLTYSDGTPFFWLGDTWWFCPSPLCPIDGSSYAAYGSMFKTLVDTRSSQGFSTAFMGFLGTKSPLTPSPKNWKRQDLDAWRRADRYLAYANQAGIIPILGVGFHSQVDPISTEDLRQLWRYVIARYSAYAVTWLVVGEYNVNNVPGRVSKVLEVARYIKDADPYKRAMTVHPWSYASEGRQAWPELWYDFIMLQGGHDSALPPISIYSDAYGYRPAKPLLEGESSFEGIHDISAERVRMAAYRAVQAGAFGYTYGAHGLWYPTQDATDTKYSEYGKPLVWWKALALPGAAQMRHLRALYESVEWWNLEPRPNGVFTLEPPAEEKRILVKAKDDKLFVIYFPPRLDARFRAGLLGTDVTADYSMKWFNPRDGASELVTGTLERDKRLLFLPYPPTSEDWILVVRKLQ